MPVIVICTKSDEYDKMISNIREVGSRNAIVIGIIDKENEQVKDYLDFSIMVPSTSKDFTPIINQIPLQLLAYHCAVLRGCDVDKPRNLAKSVTVEWFFPTPVFHKILFFIFKTFTDFYQKHQNLWDYQLVF